MKAALPVMTAGATFAATVLLGMLVGVWLDQRSGTHFYVLLGLLAGLSLGAYAAYRLIARSLAA